MDRSPPTEISCETRGTVLESQWFADVEAARDAAAAAHGTVRWRHVVTEGGDSDRA